MTAGHVAIVLAAGGSRRLGEPKQLLRRGGETLLHRTVRLALATAPLRTWVVLGADAAHMAAQLDGLDYVRVDNPRWADGLGSSVQLAAAVAAPLRVRALLLGCDQPLLELAHLRALLAGAHANVHGSAATRHGDGVGVPAVASAAVLQGAGPLAGDRGLAARLRALDQGGPWTLDAPALQFDLDTPADLVLARSRGWIDAAARTPAPLLQGTIPDALA